MNILCSCRASQTLYTGIRNHINYLSPVAVWYISAFPPILSDLSIPSQPFYSHLRSSFGESYITTVSSNSFSSRQVEPHPRAGKVSTCVSFLTLLLQVVTGKNFVKVPSWPWWPLIPCVFVCCCHPDLSQPFPFPDSVPSRSYSPPINDYILSIYYIPTSLMSYITYLHISS